MAKGQVKITFNVFNEDFKKAMSEMRESTTRLNQEFRLQKEQMRLSGTEIDKLKAQMGHLGDRYKIAQEKVKATEQQLEKAKKVFGENSEEVKKLERELIKAQTEEQRFANQLNIVGQKLKESENKLLSFSKSLGKIGQGFKDAGKKMQDIGRGLTAKVTAPIVGVGTAVSKMSVDFNKEMANISTLIPGENQRLLQLKKDIQDVAITTAKSTDDIAKGTYDVISAYGDASDTMEKVEINAKSATAGLASTSDALELSSSVMKGFGDTSAEANRKVMDLSFMTLKLGQTSFPDLARSIGKVVPMTVELGASQEELFGVYSTLTGVTGDASKVSTQYQGALKALMNPTKNMTKLMKELGVENGKAMVEQFGLVGAMEKIVESSNKTGNSLQSYIGSIEGQTMALALAGKQNDTYKKKLKELENASGSMEKAFIEQAEGINKAGFSFEQAIIKMQVAGQKLGDALGPILEKVAGAVSKLADKISNLTPEQVDSIVQFGLMVAAIGPVLIVVGKLVSGISTAITVVSTISGAIGVVATGATAATPAIGALAGAINLLLGPIGLAIAGAVALGAGIVALVKHLKKDAIPEVELFGKGVSEATAEAVGGFMELEDRATIALNELSFNGKVVTKDMANSITDTFGQMKDTIIAELDEQHEETMTAMQKFAQDSKVLSREEREFVVSNAQEAYEEKRLRIENGEKQIQDIMKTASEQKRELTKYEKERINEIKAEMVEEGVKVLSDGEVEHKLIMERIKEHAEDMSARQAAEVVKNSAEQRDGAIAKAEEQYNAVVREIIRQRDETGKYTKEQAKQLIADAQRQRDGAIAEAEDMHAGVVKEAQAQAKGHVNHVDWETGEILSKWQVLKRSTKDTFKSMGEDIKNAWTQSKDWTKRTISDMGNKIETGFADFKRKTKQSMQDIKNSILNSKLADAWRKIWNFEIPKIKLPRFSISGSFGLSPPSIPKFSVKWMSEGAIFRSPTLLGMYGVGDGYKGRGRGMEAVLPISKLGSLMQDMLPIDEPQPTLVSNITFNGNYSFRDKDDIDYFLNQASLKAKRREFV